MGRRLPAPGTVMSNPVPRAMTSSARFFGMTSPSSSTITWATSPYLLIPTCTRPFAHFCGIVAEISEHVLQIAGIGRTRFGGRRLWVCCPRCDRRSRVRDRKSPAKRIGAWGVCRKLISLARELRSCHPDTRTLNQWVASARSQPAWSRDPCQQIGSDCCRRSYVACSALRFPGSDPRQGASAHRLEIRLPLWPYRGVGSRISADTEAHVEHTLRNERPGRGALRKGRRRA